MRSGVLAASQRAKTVRCHIRMHFSTVMANGKNIKKYKSRGYLPVIFKMMNFKNPIGRN